MNAVFTMDELHRALIMIKKNSAPGMDGIDYLMLKNLPVKGRKMLLNIFNDIWLSGVFPEDWRKYQVIFIDKIGIKEDSFEIWKLDYGSITNIMEVDFEIGKSIKDKGRKMNLEIQHIEGYNEVDMELIKTAKQKYNMEEKTLIMYTDGSKTASDNSTGVGIVIEDQEEGCCMSLSKQCSIFTAEAMAISTALKIAESKIDSIKNVIVFTD
ncbi:hypothetical protein DMN91_009531, partial [Ooceraea biroi]